ARLGSDGAVLYVDDDQGRVPADAGRAPKADRAIGFLLFFGNNAVPGLHGVPPLPFASEITRYRDSSSSNAGLFTARWRSSKEARYFPTSCSEPLVLRPART